MGNQQLSNVIKIDFPNDEKVLNVIYQKIIETAHEEMEKQAELMKGYAQIFVPVDTGSLRDSIRIEEVPTQSPDFSRQIRVRAGGYVTNPKTGRKVDYAAYVEATQPFMEPAYEMVRDQILEILNELIPEQINNLDL